MNRIQFWITIGLSSFVCLLLLAQILLSQKAAWEQGQIAQAQQILQQGQAFQGNLKQLAMRIVQVSQANGGDQGLKDLLARNQISFTPATDNGNGTAPAPAPTH